MLNINTLPDEALVELVRTKDQELYAGIVSRYQSKLLRYVSNLIQDDHQAIDAVQTTLIKAFVNLNGFNTKMKFSSWIYRIAHNEAVNLLGKHYKEVPLPDGFDAATDEDIQDNLIKEEIVKQVKNCLINLPVIYADPLSLYYLEEKSYEEIGDILRLPIGTVSVRISRAKSIMRKLCKKNR